MSIDVYSFMARKGLKNQKQMGEKLNVTQATVSSWSSGVRMPTYEMCQQLLMKGMTIQELFGDEVAEKCIVYADKNKENNVSKPSMSESDILAIIDRKMAEFKSHYKEGKI